MSERGCAGMHRKEVAASPGPGKHNSTVLCRTIFFLFIGVLAPLFSQDVSIAGRIEHPGLVEASGLTPSRRHPGVIWSHNDTGTPAFLFGLRENGESVGAYEVQDGRLIDWEAVSTDEDGRLFFADIGTNGLVRTHSAIHRVSEPDVSQSWGRAEVEETWLLRFPGEREDCESFFISDRVAYIIAKYPRLDGVAMYKFSLLEEADTVLLERVGAIEAPAPVSDAALSPDKSRLALLTEEGVLILFIGGNPESAPTAPRRFLEYEDPSPGNERGELFEGVSFTTNGVLVVSELVPEILLFSGTLASGAPIVRTGLLDQSTFVGRTVVFSAEIEGFPTPSFQWLFNGQVLPGQTSSNLTLTNVTLENAGLYELVASNPAGTVRTQARLTVREQRADLRITEVMSSPLDEPDQPEEVDKADWWELTNFGETPLDLTGWRFNDSTGGLIDAFEIPEVQIEPGESIVFVENEELSIEPFLEWWGPENLPAGVKVIPYTGARLSFSAEGDSLRLWDDATADDNAIFTRADFGAAVEGRSFSYDPAMVGFGLISEIGVNGAFAAAVGGDIGSPGRIGSLRLRTGLVEGGIAISLETATTDGQYLLETRRELGSGNWESTGQIFAAPNSTINFPRDPGSGSRFYRVRKQ